VHVKTVVSYRIVNRIVINVVTFHTVTRITGSVIVEQMRKQYRTMNKWSTVFFRRETEIANLPL